MRRQLFVILFSSLLRQQAAQSVAHTRKILAVEYPVCRRDFTCLAPFQSYPTITSGLSDKAGRMAQPAEKESEILEKNSARDEAIKCEESVEHGAAPKEETLPKLSLADFRVYNSMAEHMEYFHNHFRQTWTLFQTACTNNQRPASMTLKQFINTGLQFCSHLSTHHAIEEQYVFPILAARMPEFRQGKNAAELLRQHKAIHAGMDIFEDYLQRCKQGETELDLRVLKAQMDTWGDVLWTHLDQEVRTLGAENMRKYWSLEEMRRMPR